MAYETITVDAQDGVALIRLNRPEAMNALNMQLVGEVCAALQSADADPAVRCIILTGSDKAFAAGADIKEMAGKTYAEVLTEDMFGIVNTTFARLRKPVIAAVAGYALGGGCELAMACDFILCADNAKFGQPEVNLGIIAGLGGTQRLTRLVGKSKAMEMNLTGRLMDAQEAEPAGLASRVVPLAELLDEARAVAAKIAAKSAPSIALAKESVNRALELSLAEGLLFERRLFHSLFATEDQKEGMAAFAEKRAPQFRDC